MKQGKRIKAWQLVVIGLASACVSLAANICVAKMSEGAVSGEGSLSVAKWDISVDGAGNGVVLVAGGPVKTYTLTVTNDSDVACDYIIELSNIPNGVWVGLDENELQEPDADGKVSFTDIGNTLDLSNRTKEHKLKFSAELESDAVSDDNIDVNVLFTQKEPE